MKSKERFLLRFLTCGTAIVHVLVAFESPGLQPGQFPGKVGTGFPSGVAQNNKVERFRDSTKGENALDWGDTLMMKEFREFIARGNVMDLAVGVIIGGAFGLIVKSLTDDIIMPVIGAIFGGFDFSNYFMPLSSTVTATTLEAAREQGAVFAYGNFLTVVVNFLILAWIIFLHGEGRECAAPQGSRKAGRARSPAGRRSASHRNPRPFVEKIGLFRLFIEKHRENPKTPPGGYHGGVLIVFCSEKEVSRRIWVPEETPPARISPAVAGPLR